MAKVSAHGAVVGTVEYIATAKRYMSDGAILKNNGFGWKLGGRLKPGITPQQAYANAKERLAKRLADNPALAVYRDRLHDMTGQCKRWKLHMAVQMMPDDPDGVWSEACDGYGDNVHADVEEVAQLCASYTLAMREATEGKVAEPA